MPAKSTPKSGKPATGATKKSAPKPPRPSSRKSADPPPQTPTEARNASTIILASGQNIRCTPHGLHIEGHISYEQWLDLLKTIHSVKSAFHCVLADHINYGREKFGVARVAVALEQAEFDLADVTKADSIGQTSLDFREKHALNSEHYFVLSKLPSPQEQERWASIAKRESLSPLELSRSIQAGKILHTSQITALSGQGSGINTIQGVVFKLQQWEREMGGPDRIVKLPTPQRRALLELLTPMITLAAALEESLTGDPDHAG
jgi:hypothetical protein